jgi:hypothetical protein
MLEGGEPFNYFRTKFCEKVDHIYAIELEIKGSKIQLLPKLTCTWKVTVKIGWERNFMTKDIILTFPFKRNETKT